MRLALLLGAVAGTALGGCGGDSATRPELEVGISADWNWTATSAAEVGFVYALVVQQKKQTDGSCDDLPASLQILAFGQPVPLTRDADNCLNSEVAATPTMASSSVTVTAEENGEMIAEGTFDDLLPGLGATLVTPADGMVHAGDEIVISPTPGLPSSEIATGSLFPLEGTPWPGAEYTADLPTRFPDGVHVHMPVFSGRAAVVLRGSPYGPQATVNCHGFAVCLGDASNVLGPVFVTEAM